MRRLTARIGFSDVDARTVTEIHRIIADRLDKTQTGHLIFDETRIKGHISDLMANFNSEAHQLGTTRMSDSSRNGVVDANCRSHEVDDLFVVGGSVFPTSGYANPLLTIVALSVPWRPTCGRGSAKGRLQPLTDTGPGSRLARVEERRDQREYLCGPAGHADVRGPGEHCQLRVRQESEHLHHVGQR
jgi:GMC oxidoreductase